jgi:hypothetical protein
MGEFHLLGVGAAPGLRQSGVQMVYLVTSHMRHEAAGTAGQIPRAELGSHNKLVNTDAQGRPLGRSAPCAPFLGRRSRLR